jgi:hypothetical protein
MAARPTARHADAQGGDIVLDESTMGGLKATIRLPSNFFHSPWPD